MILEDGWRVVTKFIFLLKNSTLKFRILSTKCVLNKQMKNNNSGFLTFVKGKGHLFCQSEQRKYSQQEDDVYFKCKSRT